MKTYAYTRYRLANTWLRLQLREGMVVVIFILFAMLILTAVNRSACSSRIISVLGVIPISFMWSILLLCRSYYIAPTLYNPKHTVLMERQMFAWAATEVGDMARERTHPEEPVFSYETALLMLFWSILAYRETKVCFVCGEVYICRWGGFVCTHVHVSCMSYFACLTLQYPAMSPGKE